MPPPGSTIVAAADDVDSLYHNPFAASSSTSSFSSAYTPKDAQIGARPTLRRRGSEGPARRSRNDHDPFADDTAAAAHVRSRTMGAVVGSSSATSLRHPLAISSLGSNASSSRSSLTDTRPRLKRLLSNLETTSTPHHEEGEESGLATSPTNDARLKERLVIVSSKDSLPGVALKYGISLADLRRANQMWPSDQIHLRKVLYIPLDKSHKAKDFVLSQLEVNSTPPSLDEQSINEEDKPSVNGAGSSLTIRRVSASQLSFFPPPSSSSLSLSSSISHTVSRSANNSLRRDAIPFRATPSNYSFLTMSASLSIPDAAVATALTVPSANSLSGRGQIPSLSTLFSGLPIGRISFDSNTSTPSQVSDDQEHEMNDVSHRNSLDEPRDIRDPRPRTPSAKPSPNAKVSPRQNGLELRLFPEMQGGHFPEITASRDTRATRTPTKDPKTAVYVSPDRRILAPETVRTSQLEPSPAMQLPLRPGRSRDG
ncbi:carbohydrate-binding module family 50 protein [Phanerochaete carnosa HHB-10118-sp]|uniref:Carbohydrate-binding module family 50 protein n=1 Tax=Phanerochaete carnosa (strain HHB-10118-sp) TaxID=650164 RepID=K5W6E5_PHACS|nr:carbohydrate-binding module family 50 protein [Phanerochaete carnosa HHB-10118-sp]EKM54725.1 carbohydrate-binding module family 50 protein [Phanerochaete carnosa HHB-10118-sp]